MNAIDTNVLIYRLDKEEPEKRAKARRLLTTLGADDTVLLWQVLGETVRQVRYRQDQGGITREALLRYTSTIRNVFPLVVPTPDLLDHALDLSGRFSLSHWDSMLLGACIEANVDTLYTEDMGAPITYDSVELVNPFA